MKARVYLNEGEFHWDGYLPEHFPALKLGTVLDCQEYPDPIEALEVIWQVCNGADPQSDVLWYQFGNRSLSVGDVVAFEIDGCQEAWACASVGWDRIEFPTQVPV